MDSIKRLERMGINQIQLGDLTKPEQALTNNKSGGRNLRLKNAVKAYAEKILKKEIKIGHVDLDLLEAKTKTLLTELVNKQNCLCFYVTFNKPSQILLKQFKKAKINTKNIYFFDAITRLSEDADTYETCSFLDSPKQLDHLLTIIRTKLELLEGKNIFLVLDNLTNVLHHNTREQTVRFVQALTNKLRLANVGGHIIVTNTDVRDILVYNAFKNFADAS